MSIKYFDHPYHLLSLSNRKRDDLILCKACQKPCDGQTYICSEGCDYNLHESCAKFPRDVQSPFHPHPLILSRRGKSYDKYLGCTDTPFLTRLWHIRHASSEEKKKNFGIFRVIRAISAEMKILSDTRFWLKKRKKNQNQNPTSFWVSCFSSSSSSS